MPNRFDTLPSPGWFRHGLLLAVSGGADSTAMLHIFARFAESRGVEKPAVAHVDHGLRGAESEADALFVRELADRYGLRFAGHAVAPEQWASAPGAGREATARQIRYDFLVRTAGRLGRRYLAAAHTADDQAETVLHRILRGTGIAGLAGMPRFRALNPAVTLVRPLLDVRRRELLDYLDALGEPHRVDATNRENDFTRNRIRNVLLPMLRNEFNPDVDGALRRLAGLAGETAGLVDRLLDAAADRVVLRRGPGEIVLDAARLRGCEKAAIRELFVRLWRESGWPLREMGFEQWDRLADFFLHGKGDRPVRGGVVASHRGGTFRLQANAGDSGASR